MNFLELVKARHSVRSYVERPIEQSKLIIYWNVCVWHRRQ